MEFIQNNFQSSTLNQNRKKSQCSLSQSKEMQTLERANQRVPWAESHSEPAENLRNGPKKREKSGNKAQEVFVLLVRG